MWGMLFQHAFPRRYAAALWVKHGEATARDAHRMGQVSVPFEWGVHHSELIRECLLNTNSVPEFELNMKVANGMQNYSSNLNVEK